MNKPKAILILSVLMISVVSTTLFFSHNISLVKAQPAETTESGEGDSSDGGGSNSSCSAIGNNLAVPFGQGEDGDGAKYSLAIWNGTDSNSSVVSAINSSPGTIIVRLGVGLNADVGNPDIYAQSLRKISEQVGGKQFIAQVTHNEANCAEYEKHYYSNLASADQQADYAKKVIPQISGYDIIPITGQIDYFCAVDVVASNTGLPAPDSPAKYITTLGSVPGIKGVGVPFYVSTDLGGSENVLGLFEGAISNTSNDIYITESGPFKRGPGLEPTEEDMREYITGVQEVLKNSRVKALMLFNALGLNPDENFAYTIPFHDPVCRETLRTSCYDTEAVLEACDGLFEIVACEYPDHSCKCICEGTSSKPCADTPQYDCSYPVDMGEFFQVGLGEDKVELVKEYLNKYLPETSITRGKQFYLTSSIDYTCGQAARDADAAGLGPPAVAICENHTGGSDVSIDVDGKPVNAIDAVTTKNEVTRRLDWSTGAFHSKEYTSVEGAGPMQKGMPSELQMYRMSVVQDLKKQCYSRGDEPHTDLIDLTQYGFGKVRCMNYRYLRGSYSERNLFSEYLSTCTKIHTSNNSTKQIEMCETEWENLLDRDPELFALAQEIPDLVINTFPVIGGVDVLGTEDEDLEEGEYDPEKTTIGNVFRGFSKITLGMLFEDGPNASSDGLGTGIYVYPITAGVDTLEASKATFNMLKPVPINGNQDEVYESQNPRLNNLANLVLTNSNFLEPIYNLPNAEAVLSFLYEFFNLRQGNPFWIDRIPDFRSGDVRFVQVQLSLYNNVGECMKDPTDNLDSTMWDSTPKIEGDDTSYSAKTILANLVNTVYETINLVDSFRTLRFQVCELFPGYLAESDKYATVLTQLFTPPEIETQSMIEESFKNYVNSPLTADGGGNTTPPDLGETAKNPPGFGDNECNVPEGATVGTGEVDPTTGEEGSLDVESDADKSAWCAANWEPKDPYFEGLPMLADWGYYCGYFEGYEDPSIPDCPPEVNGARFDVEPKESEDLKGGRKTGVQFRGGSSQFTFTGNAPRKFWAMLGTEFKELADGTYVNYFYCNRKNDPNCEFKEVKDVDPQKGDTCGFNGGIPGISPELSSLISSMAAEYNIPVEVLLAVLQGENCRSSTNYGGESASICDADTSPLLLEPGQPWPYVNGCDGGSDANPSVKGVLQIDTRFWGAELAGGNACSIYDSFKAASTFFSKHLGSSTDPTAMKKALFLWVYGDGGLDWGGTPGDCGDITRSGGSVHGAAYAYCYAIDELITGTSSSPDGWVKNLEPVSESTCN